MKHYEWWTSADPAYLRLLAEEWLEVAEYFQVMTSVIIELRSRVPPEHADGSSNWCDISTFDRLQHALSLWLGDGLIAPIFRLQLSLQDRCDILRDVIGVPYAQGWRRFSRSAGLDGRFQHPQQFHASWLTTHVRAIVDEIASSDAAHFNLTDMNVLADALEDAGCCEGANRLEDSSGPTHLLRHLRNQTLTGCSHCLGKFVTGGSVQEGLETCPHCTRGLVWTTQKYPHCRSCWAISFLKEMIACD